MDPAVTPQICPVNSYYEDTSNYIPETDDPHFQMSSSGSPLGSSSDVTSQSSDPLSANSGGSVARRNERERKRVKMVNMGFAKLRQYVPLATRGKRLSKVETLRSAIDYIRQLRQLLLYQQEQQRMEDPVYYHLYDQPHPLYQQHHHQQQQQHQRMYQPFDMTSPRNSGYYYDGMGAIGYAGDVMMECGSGAGGWSVSSESPCSSVESEITSSPPCLPESDHEVGPCWTV